MLSIGDLLDKLIIENIKIAKIKEQLREPENEGNPELYEKMMVLNTNRGIIINAIGEKIEQIAKGGKNRILQTVKTYQ